MNKLYTLLIVALFFFSAGFAQIKPINGFMPLKKEKKEADKHFYNENYKEAAVCFERLLEHEAHPDYLFKLGYCYMQTTEDNKKSIELFKKALELSKDMNRENSDLYFYLATAYHKDYDFGKALKYVERFKKRVSDVDESLYDIKQLEGYCKNGEEYINNPVGITLINMSSQLNTEFHEHSPVISLDEKTMIFTSSRKGTGGKKLKDGQYFEDIYISTYSDCEWSIPQNPENINSRGHEAACGISADGNKMLVFRKGNIYVSLLEDNIWSELYKVKRPINKMFSRETHAVFSADDQYLYFTSNRRGGYGGLDIYVAKRKSDGTYGNIKNLGPEINTPYDEETPYIMPDGITMYFSSRGHATMGGYDVFKSKWMYGKWTTPENMGYPINTVGDDVFFVPTESGKRAYYSSKQNAGFGGKDLYTIWFNDANQLPLYAGSVVDDTDDALHATFTITNLNSMETENEYITNERNSRYSMINTPCNDHNVLIQKEGHVFEYQDINAAEEGDTTIHKNTIVLPSVHKQKLKKTYTVAGSYEEVRYSNSAKRLINIIGDFMNEHEHLYLDVSFPESRKDEGNTYKEIEGIFERLANQGVNKKRMSKNDYSLETPEGKISFTLLDSLGKVLSVNEEKVNIIAEKEVEIMSAAEEMTTFAEKEKVYVIRDLLFNFNRYTTSRYNDNLNKLAEYLNNNKTAVIEIGGHTDIVGSAQYNKVLAKKRAEFVKLYLEARGVDSKQLKIKIYGESNVLAVNNKKTEIPEDKVQKYNRRVELKAVNKGDKPLILEPIDVPDVYRKKKKAEEKTIYSVILKQSDVKLNKKMFKGFSQVYEYINNEGKYVYYYGRFTSDSDAQTALSEILKAGYSEAYIFIPD